MFQLSGIYSTEDLPIVWSRLPSIKIGILYALYGV